MSRDALTGAVVPAVGPATTRPPGPAPIVVAQRSAPAAVPPTPLPLAPTSTPLAPSDPAAAALSTGAARVDADGAVVFAPPAGWATSSPPAAPEPAVIQRAADEPAPAPMVPGVASPAVAPAGPAGSAPAGGPQLDELAAHLYDRIRERLRAELRLDRERRGRVTDLAR